MTETMSKEKVPKFDRYNKSTLYLLPLIAKSIELDFSYLIENTYIYCGVEAEHIGIVYNVSGLEPDNVFFGYELILRANSLYLYEDYIDDTHKLFVFKFPEDYIPDFKRFLKGQYSKFSEPAKKEIISYAAIEYKYQPVVEDLAGVLWKKKERKIKLEKKLAMSIPDDVELASIVNLEDESLKTIANDKET